MHTFCVVSVSILLHNLDRLAQLTRCFSAVAELLVKIG